MRMLVILLLLSACGTDDGPASTEPTFALAGVVQGLRGSDLVLRAVGSDQRILGNGPFAFYRRFEDGTAFEVTVRGQPVGPAQACLVTNGTGVIEGADVTQLVVACENVAFAVGGTVVGLTGEGLLLQNNGVDVLGVEQDGAFAFPMPVEDEAAFDVRVFQQPTDPDQTCAVTGGEGVVAGADVTNVAVTCVTL